MLEIGLFSLAWQLDPISVDGSKRNGSVTAFIRPQVKTVEPDADHATSMTLTTDANEIMFLLKEWEQSTSNQPAWNRSRKEEFRQSIQREFNKHTVVAAEQLVGHVSSDVLNETYQWKIVDRTEKLITLEAFPRDDTDRLFYRCFRISLRVSEAIPDQIVVVGRNQKQGIVWPSGQRTDANRIQLVNFQDDVPPAPMRLITTADSRID
ncbi:MAG: hypothetical protein WCH39_03335 [Schlesneria sp.]